MNAGIFDVRITIQRATQVVSTSSGARVPTWSNYQTIWAGRKEQPSTQETINADRRENKQIYIFTIRYNSAVTVRDRVLHDGSYFNILSISEMKGRKMYQELLCELTQ